MNRFAKSILLGAALLFASVPAFAAPIAYPNSANINTPEDAANQAVTLMNSNLATQGPGSLNGNIYTGKVASTVNLLSLTGSATTVAPTITVGGSSSDANVALQVAGAGTGIVQLGGNAGANGWGCTVTASADAGTCNGQRGLYTTAALSTAASTLATAQTVTDSSVSANGSVMCWVSSYAGTWHTNGVPMVQCPVTAAHTFLIEIQNVDTANALNSAVVVGFLVVN